MPLWSIYYVKLCSINSQMIGCIHCMSCTNTYGDTHSNSDDLLLVSCHSVPPTLTFFPSAVRDVVSGESLVASCRATGDPSPVIQWLRGNQLLDGVDQPQISVSQSSDSLTTSSQLTVTGFTSEDMGGYSCVAVNDLGKVPRTFQVNIVCTFSTLS